MRWRKPNKFTFQINLTKTCLSALQTVIFSFCSIKFYSNQSGAGRAWCGCPWTQYLLSLVLLLPEEGSNINVLLEYSANQNDYFTSIVSSQSSSAGQWSTIHTKHRQTLTNVITTMQFVISHCEYEGWELTWHHSRLTALDWSWRVVDVLSQFSWLRDDPSPDYSDYVANHAPSIPCVQSSDLTLSHYTLPLWLPPPTDADTQHKADTNSS